jgi:hypothetical protein
MDKKLALVKRIMGKYYYKPKYDTPVSKLREYKLNKLLGKKAKEPETFLGVNPKSEEHKERLFVYSYFYKQGKSDDDVCAEWLKVQQEKRWVRANYNIMPKEGRDNQNPVTNTRNYNGGGGNRNSIRVPSKKHKNRFKNFLKLFPHLKEKYDEMETKNK